MSHRSSKIFPLKCTDTRIFTVKTHTRTPCRYTPWCVYLTGKTRAQSSPSFLLPPPPLYHAVSFVSCSLSPFLSRLLSTMKGLASVPGHPDERYGEVRIHREALLEISRPRLPELVLHVGIGVTEAFLCLGRKGMEGRGGLNNNQNAPRPSEHPPVRGGKCQNV